MTQVLFILFFTCVMYFEHLLTPLCVDFEKKKALYFVLKDERVEQCLRPRGSEFQM